VYAQIDTLHVRVPAELSGFCRAGTESVRPASTPPAAPPAPGDDIPAATVYSHAYGSLEQPVRCVVRRAEDWAALWAAVRRNVHASPPAAAPAVDFGARMVLLAGMGTRPTTAYGIAISGVRRTEAGLVVSVVQSITGGCEVGMAETEPIHAVSIPRADAPVQFVESVRYGSDCEPR
jgi:hypothetical protein